MKLHYRIIGEGKPFVILHGLFGFSDNWQTHAQKLSAYYQVILVDQRNHGHSDWSDSHSYEEMAEDLKELCDDLSLKDIILLGHSMGGKSAMYFTEKYEEYVEKLIVVDMGIKAYPPHLTNIIQGIKSLDLDAYTARSQADEVLKEIVPNYGERQFLLKNLYWIEKGKLAWRMNFKVLEDSLPAIFTGFTPEKEISIPTLFIKGGNSNYIKIEDWPSIEEVFIDVQLEIIEEAGHWVHAEKPDEFLETVLSFCLR